MSKISPVTVGLIEKHPQTAARAVAKMEPVDAAAFFETLPRRHAVMIVSNLSAWSASAIISHVMPAKGAAILSELDYQTTASILRVIPGSDQDKLLSALPKRLSQDLTSTLTYPADTVGAKMSTSTVVMMADQTAGNALAELREIKRAKAGVVYVVDGERKLLGVVSAGELLQHSNGSILGKIIDRSVVPISARSRLSAVKSLPAWDDYAHMPVVNRQKILIGALARRTFRQPVVQAAVKSTRAATPSILASMASTFVASALGLAEILASADVMHDTSDEAQSSFTAGDNS